MTKEQESRSVYHFSIVQYITVQYTNSIVQYSTVSKPLELDSSFIHPFIRQNVPKIIKIHTLLYCTVLYCTIQ